MQFVYDDFQLLRTPLIGETPFAMRFSYKWPPIRTTVVRGLFLTQAAQQVFLGPCYMAQFGIGRNEKHGAFH